VLATLPTDHYHKLVFNLDELTIDDNALQTLRKKFAVSIQEGLEHQNTQIAALPTFLERAPSQKSGECLVLDCGGTNIRAARVHLKDDQSIEVVAGPVTGAVPDSSSGTPADVFLDRHVDLLQQLGDISGLPLGYCFSYPSENSRTGDAKLLRWTKGLQFEGMVGEYVGELLVEACRLRSIEITKVNVLNDTVATLFANKLLDDATHIGLIVGTGTNMATFASGRHLRKCEDWPEDHWMAVNLESGNLALPHLTEVDRLVDESSSNPKRQTFEKAVSGMYLPKLLMEICPEAQNITSAESLVNWSESHKDLPLGIVSRRLLTRSARLVASGLAAVFDVASDVKKSPRIQVSAEGSLFWGDPLYKAEVHSTLQALFDGEIEASFQSTSHANLIGAARAVLS